MIMPIGSMVGSFVGGDLMKRGRRKVLIEFLWIYIIGSCLTLIETIALIFIGRLICAFCVGVFICVSPKFMNEICSPALYSKVGIFP